MQEIIQCYVGLARDNRKHKQFLKALPDLCTWCNQGHLLYLSTRWSSFVIIKCWLMLTSAWTLNLLPASLHSCTVHKHVTFHIWKRTWAAGGGVVTSLELEGQWVERGVTACTCCLGKPCHSSSMAGDMSAHLRRVSIYSRTINDEGDDPWADIAPFVVSWVMSLK
jgi:hypothetical protein